METGKLELMVVVGVVNEGYDTSSQPGLEDGTVGYYTDGYILPCSTLTKGINQSALWATGELNKISELKYFLDYAQYYLV